MAKKGRKALKQPGIQICNQLSYGSPGVSRRSIPANAQIRNAILLFVLTAATVFIYGQVWSFTFIGWDDPLYVSENTQVLKGISWEGIRWALASGHAANWHPLTWISHMLDVQLFGVAPGPIHIINVLFHLANSLLLFWLLLRMTSAWSQSAFVAALFAVHPLRVESVAWVAERKDVLSTFFLLLTVLAYTAYVRQRNLRNYLLVSAIFGLALMSKPMVVTLPLLLFLLDIWPLDRIHLSRSDRKIWLQLAIEKMPLLIMAGIVSVVTLWVQHQGGTVAAFEAFPLGARFQNAAVSLVAYLAKMLWPVGLSPVYPYRELSVLAVAGSILILTGISISAIRFRDRCPFFLVGWIWYLLALIPVIGIIQVGDQARADRYKYLPLIGIFIILAWGVPKLLPPKVYKLPITIAALLVICILSLSARAQTAYWKNAVTLWRHAVDSTVNSPHAHINLGLELMNRGERKLAIAHYEEALRINPDFAEAHNALGAALLSQSHVNEAAFHFEQALRLKPTFIEAQANMAAVLARKGKAAEAISFFTQALATKPEDAKLHYNMGLALAEMGNIQEAIVHYSEAIRIKPEFADPHIQLGNLLFSQGQAEQAIEQYTTAIRIEPSSADPHNNLGIVLADQGRLDQALAECNEALRLNPASAIGRNVLGTVLARTGRGEEAIREYRQALQIDPKYAEAHYNLAVILMQRNRDDEAIPSLREVLSIRPDFIDARLNLAVALLNNGHASEATIHLKEVLHSHPDNQAAKSTLAIALARQKTK